MKYLAIIVVSSIAFLIAWLPSKDKTAKYCGREYVEKQGNEYLKDEGIPIKSVDVIDKKTKKVIFGYIKSAIRNDTNFIYTKFSYVGDTIIIKEYHDYKISDRTDSIIRRYVCAKKGLFSYKSEYFWEGKRVIVDSTKRIIVKY